MQSSSLRHRFCIHLLAAGLLSGLSTVSFAQVTPTTQDPSISASQVAGAHDSSTCNRCQNGVPCIPSQPDYPAFQRTYGNPYRIMDCRNGECESSMVERWKRSMQASHWGYPEYFHRNTYGYAHRNAFANNIRDGAIERSTLYQLDFYPEDSPKAHMLTPKGLERLEKAVCVSASFGSPLRIEKSVRSDLNEQRRKWLSEHPSVAEIGILPDSIVLIARPMGIQATEAIRNYQQGISPSRSSGQGMANPGVSSGFPLLPSSGSSMGSSISR